MNRDDLRRALEPFALEGGTCPPKEAIWSLAAQSTSDREAECLRAHLASCPACLELWSEARLASGSVRGGRALPVRTRWRKWEWALAASLAVAMGGLGVSAYKWASLQRDNRRLSSELAWSKLHEHSPAPARLVELMPDSFVLRGAKAAPPTVPATGATALLLVTLEPLPPGAEARLLGAQGRLLWRGVLPQSADTSTVLHIPPGVLVPGQASVEVVEPSSGGVLLRFPFVVGSDSPQ